MTHRGYYHSWASHTDILQISNNMCIYRSINSLKCYANDINQSVHLSIYQYIKTYILNTWILYKLFLYTHTSVCWWINGYRKCACLFIYTHTHNEIFCHKKGNVVIFDSTGETEDTARWKKPYRERQNLHGLACVSTLKSLAHQSAEHDGGQRLEDGANGKTLVKGTNVQWCDEWALGN